MKMENCSLHKDSSGYARRPKLLFVNCIRTHIPFNVKIASLLSSDFDCVFLLDLGTNWDDADLGKLSHLSNPSLSVVRPPERRGLTSVIEALAKLKYLWWLSQLILHL